MKSIVEMKWLETRLFFSETHKCFAKKKRDEKELKLRRVRSRGFDGLCFLFLLRPKRMKVPDGNELVSPEAGHAVDELDPAQG